jgi:hypothetical protein
MAKNIEKKICEGLYHSAGTEKVGGFLFLERLDES